MMSHSENLKDNLDKKIDKTLENVLIILRNHVPYKVFTELDKSLRLHIQSTKKHCRVFCQDIDLYEDFIASEIHSLNDLQKRIMNRYDGYMLDPEDDNFICLIPGREYMLSINKKCMKTYMDDQRINDHPFLHDIPVTYIGRDINYPEESHTFTLGKTFMNRYENMDFQNDAPYFSILTCVCKLHTEDNNQSMKMHICADKFKITWVH